MKRFLLVFVSFLASNQALAADYFLPDGCYVAYQYPGYCYSVGYGNIMHWTESADQNLLSQRYGPAMAVVMSRAFEVGAELNTCIDDYNRLVGNYNTLRSTLNKKTKLAKRLKQACGSKCNNIK